MTVARVDPRLLPLLAIGRLGARRDAGLPMSAKRERSAALSRRGRGLVMPAGPRCDERDVEVPVDGGTITVRLYRPPMRLAGAAPTNLPLHVFFHGGGWCVGTLHERDPRCREIAVGADCVVASVDYRLAPEHPFPTPLEDCYAALGWLAEHGEDLGIDATRIAVGGESAGANLAAAVCLLARDRGGPAIAHQWLDVPAVDLTLSAPSIEEVPDGYLLERADMEAYIACYLPDPALTTDPAVSPLFADDHGGLPPAWVTACELDKLRDDATRYADALRSAGVQVRSQVLAGMFHASFAFTRILPAARRYEREAIAALAGALGTSTVQAGG